jgi:hypothetical protein
MLDKQMVIGRLCLINTYIELQKKAIAATIMPKAAYPYALLVALAAGWNFKVWKCHRKEGKRTQMQYE